MKWEKMVEMVNLNVMHSLPHTHTHTKRHTPKQLGVRKRWIIPSFGKGDFL